jgi:hypothetical protein
MGRGVWCSSERWDPDDSKSKMLDYSAVVDLAVYLGSLKKNRAIQSEGEDKYNLEKNTVVYS